MNQLAQEEVAQLRSQVAALEELLAVYEQETLEKSHRLEQTLQELKHSDAALQVLKSILTSMGDGVVVVDETGKLVLMNVAAKELLGFQADHTQFQDWIAAQTFYPAASETRLTVADFPISRAMQGEAIDHLELYHWPQGEPVWLSVTARSLQNDQGLAQGAVAVFHNITASKHAETALRQSEAHARDQAEKLVAAFHELQQTQAQLIQTEKMSSLGQLVAGIAHEINNPINFIYGNLCPAQEYINDVLHVLRLYQQYYPQPAPAIQTEIEAIDLAFVQEDLPKLLRSLHMGAERIRQIVLSLRNFSRLDEAAMKPVNIHDGIDNTLLILQNQLKPKPDRCEVHVVKEYGNLPPVECFAGQLNQVFMNIVSNAIDALDDLRQHPADPTAAPPTIWIQTAMEAGDRVQIRIRNNGPSIDPASIFRLFDPFFTTKPVGQGTGLGLYISYQIITEKHNGILDCWSEPGQGVEFRISIPVTQALCT